MSSVSELRQLAKTIGVRGYSVAKKAELIALIEKKQNPAPAPAPAAPSAPAVIEMAAPAAIEKVKSKSKKAQLAEAQTAVVAVEPKEVSKRMNEWNTFLADYRKEHNVSLRQAMAEAKDAYGKHKESKKAYTSPDCP